MEMIWYALIGVLFLSAGFFMGFRKICLYAYYGLKGIVFKVVEYFLRSLIALIGIKMYFWMVVCVAVLVVEVLIPLPTAKIVSYALFVVCCLVFFHLFISNFNDEDDRDYVRMLLAQLEHRLCFKNPKLSIYPYDWHWFE